ncbi:MAG: hypothetical protein ACR65R_09060 [Methylomicrobium sp.]
MITLTFISAGVDRQERPGADPEKRGEEKGLGSDPNRWCRTQTPQDQIRLI